MPNSEAIMTNSAAKSLTPTMCAPQVEAQARAGWLDKLVCPEVRLFNTSWSTFHVFGCTGLALAIFLAMTLAAQLGLSQLVMVGIVLASVTTIFALVMASKIFTGEEQFTYYHHEIAVMAVAALLLWLLRQPILPYLDVTMLGIGAFLACGRVGCLMVGCCHGRPHRWGVCYRKEHADAGFTSYYVGVRLFPIQAVESLWVFCIVVAGIAFVLNGHPPGTALAWYVVAYDLGRFWFEFLRGDPERAYYWGFSEAQWISLLRMGGVVWAEMAGVLPFNLWHAAATACLALAMTAISLVRHFRKTARHQLLHPHHVKEVAEAMARVSTPATETKVTGQWTILPRRNSIPTRVHIGCTSRGIQISRGKISGTVGDISHYTLSCRDGGMTEETARVLAWLILQLKRATGSSELVKGNRDDVFHLLIHPGAKKELVY